MKKTIILFIGFLCLYSCTSLVEKYTKQENKIISGVGFEEFKVNETTIDEFIAELGDDYKEIEHNNYSVEIVYEKLGLSFYYKQNDQEKKVFTIIFEAPFNGITDKGIKIGDTMQEAIDQYGMPTWGSCDQCDIWYVDYDYAGIQFTVKRDTTLPHFPLNEEAHINRKIIKIAVKAKTE